MDLKNREAIEHVLSSIKPQGRRVILMHVCGTHQDTIVKYGLDSLLKPLNIELREGPGCPVCVTTTKEIEMALELAFHGVTITTFGDMLKTPGERGSLYTIGKRVKVVYSIEDSIKYAKEHPNEDVVFLGVGFETTMPLTAYYILNGMPKNHYVLSLHRFTPPAVEAVLAGGDVKLDGLILPGHVSTIIGKEAWRFIQEEFNIPQVVTGFEPLDVIVSVKLLIDMLSKGIVDTINEYTRAVLDEGNVVAKKAIEEAFDVVEIAWRGLGLVPRSGAKIKEKFSEYDAEKVFEHVLSPVNEREYKDPPGCRCGDVIRGVITPFECPLFGKACTPDAPVGPCMVSSEGACAILYKYRGV